jgi:Protein of unknown function (DUF2637)
MGHAEPLDRPESSGPNEEQGVSVPVPQLRRVRWAVRATLTLGVAASVVANVLHAQDNPISQAIAAWPPLALLLTVELISRVPVHRRSLAVARLAATATIAGIAAWVSYWHMAGVAARYGETGASPYLLPLSVDGLIVVASICLVELGGRIAAAETATLPAPTGATMAASPRHAADGTASVSVRIGDTEPAAAPTAGDRSMAATVAATAGVPAAAAPTAGVPAAAVRGGTQSASRAATAVTDAPGARLAAVLGAPRATSSSDAKRRSDTGAERKATRSTNAPAHDSRRSGKNGRKPPGKSTARPRRPVAETAALAAAIAADRPMASEEEVAKELGISTARLRAVRRQARELELAA